MRESINGFFDSLPPEVASWFLAVFLCVMVAREVRLLFFYRGRFTPWPPVTVFIVLVGGAYYLSPSMFHDALDDIRTATSEFVEKPGKMGERRTAHQPEAPTGTPYTGRVTKVIDGDTFELRIGGGKERIRFAHIDAPEKQQKYGRQSTRALKRLIDNEAVTVYVVKRDAHGRLVGKVFHNEQDVGYWMVSHGHAWWYRQYSNSDVLPVLEKEARLQRLGLWSSENPIPPWEYRRS